MWMKEVLNVHFQIFNPKEVENIKAKVKDRHLKIWVANILKMTFNYLLTF